MFAGYQLFGLVGIIIGMPIAGCVKIILAKWLPVIGPPPDVRAPGEPLLLDLGLAARDLWAYQLPVKDFMGNIGERLDRITGKVLERKNITVRQLDKKRYAEEVAKVKLLYNEAWSQNWGFVPMTDPEFQHLADSLEDTEVLRFENLLFEI